MRRRKRLRTAGGATLAFLVVYVAAWAYRATGYSARSRDLEARAATFPTRYQEGVGRRFVYVAIGDSTAVGVGADTVRETIPALIASRIAHEGRTVVVHNLSVSGARLQQLLKDQLGRLPSGPIDLVTVCVSANDATHGRDLEQFQADVAELLAALTHRNVGVVVVTTTPNFRATPAVPYPMGLLFGSRAERLATVIKQVAGRFPRVHVADLYGMGTLRPDQYAADGFHPSSSGYRDWANIIFDSLPTFT